MEYQFNGLLSRGSIQFDGHAGQLLILRITDGKHLCNFRNRVFPHEGGSVLVLTRTQTLREFTRAQSQVHHTRQVLCARCPQQFARTRCCWCSAAQGKDEACSLRCSRAFNTLIVPEAVSQFSSFNAAELGLSKLFEQVADGGRPGERVLCAQTCRNTIIQINKVST